MPSRSAEPSITVAVCTHNRYDLVRELLASLEAQSLAPERFTTLVVDNSDDETHRRAFARELSARSGVDVVESMPPGLSRARNVALERCRTKYIAYIDDDARPAPGWLEAVLDAFERRDAAVVGGPIVPEWPIPRPDWVPDKYVACLTVLDYGETDRWMAPHEFAYGANIAFDVAALREIGGFDTGLGRIGSRTLISEEELQTQVALGTRGHRRFYAAGASVTHLVHVGRVSRNYFRARMAWQAVSSLMHESPFVWAEQSHEELAAAAEELGVTELVNRLFLVRDAATFSSQITLLYHLLTLVLDSKDQDDTAFEGRIIRRSAVAPAAPAAPVTSPAPAAVTIPAGPAPPYRCAHGIAPNTRHLFVEGLSGHAFLLNTYCEMPGSQAWTLPVNTWEECGAELRRLEMALPPTLQSLVFVTLEPLVYSASAPAFLELLDRLTVPTYGILHRLPWTGAHADLLRQAAAKMAGVIVLAEGMAERLDQLYGIRDIVYLPLQATYHRYLEQDPGPVRQALGVGPEDRVISVVGEARAGKGIELLLESLPFLTREERERMFFLVAGRSKGIGPATVRDALAASGCRGFVDLRQSRDPLNYSVLSDREFGQYVSASDVGILLYQEDQRNCMSGVLPNYVYGRRPVVATANSIVGGVVQRYDLGDALIDESPRAVARALAAAIRARHQPRSKTFEQYRETLAPEAVMKRLSLIVNNEIPSLLRV